MARKPKALFRNCRRQLLQNLCLALAECSLHRAQLNRAIPRNRIKLGFDH